MKIRWHLSRIIPRLGIRIFLLILITIVLPLCIMFGYLKNAYEKYIEDELSSKIVQGISKSEDELYAEFNRMVTISNILVSDIDFQSVLDSNASYYEKVLEFDKLIRKIILNDPLVANGIRITLIDRNNKLYTNWSLNFNDYTFLLEENIVKRSMALKGHVIWGMFTPGFIREELPGSKYISLARSIDTSTSSGIPEYLCTVIVSIGQENLKRILKRYLYNNSDSIFITTPDGQIVLDTDTNGQIPAYTFQNMLVKNSDEKNSFVEKTADAQYLVSYYTLSSPWTFNNRYLRVCYFIDYREVSSQLERISGKVNTALIVSFFAVFIIILFLTANIVKPIKVLSNKMDSYSVSEDPRGLDLGRNDEIGQINRAFYRMAQNINDLFEQLKKESTAKEQYYFESLRAQLNPHFLFNTLTTIRWMALIKKEDNIVESIDALANILKYSMNKGNELVYLRDELSSIESYIELQNYRYGGRYTLKIDIDQSLMKLKVTKFILQPIVENAVIYAFKETDQEGEILIYGYIDETGKDGGVKALKLFVEDNGTGMDEKTVREFADSKGKTRRDEKKVTGIGLLNVDERIRIEYGGDFGITILNLPGKGTVVEYTLPLIRNEYAEEDPHC